MEKKMNVYELITNKVMEQMKQGIIPWHRPWTGVADGAINYVTRKPYSLLNQMLLGRTLHYWRNKRIKGNGEVNHLPTI